MNDHRRLRKRTLYRKMAFMTLVYASAIAVALYILSPFIWLVISSVAEPGDLLTRPLHWLPSHVTLRRYLQITGITPGDPAAESFKFGFMNSVTVAGAVTATSLLVGILGAYAFARLRFRFRGGLLFALLSTYMIPPVALVVETGIK